MAPKRRNLHGLAVGHSLGHSVCVGDFGGRHLGPGDHQKGWFQSDDDDDDDENNAGEDEDGDTRQLPCAAAALGVVRARLGHGRCHGHDASVARWLWALRCGRSWPWPWPSRGRSAAAARLPLLPKRSPVVTIVGAPIRPVDGGAGCAAAAVARSRLPVSTFSF
jgi:hypothetical protein